MSVVYYFETEKQNVQGYPSNKKYVCIAEPVKPMPKNGKKRLSAEQRREYDKCIELLENGHVDMNNNQLEPEDSRDFAVRMLCDGKIPEGDRLFRIEPIQSNTVCGYYNKDILVISEFDVKKEIKTTDELLDILIENYEYIAIENELFKKCQYVNYRENALNVFRKLYEKTNEKARFLEDLIHNYCCDFGNDISVHSYSHNNIAYDFAKQLMDLGYVKLYDDKSSYTWRYIIRLLKLKWTDFALEVIKAFIQNEKQIKTIRENKQVQALLSYMTDDSNVKEIIELLNINTNKLILTVKEDIDDGYDEREIEKKEFTDMGELRSYLITEYKMPFDIASKDIVDTYWNDMTFNVSSQN